MRFGRNPDDGREQPHVPPPPGPAPALYQRDPSDSYDRPDPAASAGYDWHGNQSWPPGVPAPNVPGRDGPAPPPAHPGTLAERWRTIAVDGAVPVFDPRPPTGGLSYRPDTVCDGWSTGAVDLRLASVRGYAHRAEGRPREDDAAAAWDEHTGTVVFAVADGVSDARQPHIGSQLACRSAVDELLGQIRGSGGFVTDWRKLLNTVHWQLVVQARRLLHQEEASVAETADLLATTLVAGVAVPTPEGVRVALVSVGDSGVWAIKHQQLYPLRGGKAVGADGLVSSAVQPLPYVPADIAPYEYLLDPGSVLLVGTDGFGDPVGDGRGAVAHLFACELERPLPPLAFAHLLDFYRETFDDDRTLVALWPRAAAPGGSL
ncbi:protein phosphatase 2C domain-containing protein [Streptomyces olivochromogenes]|uniref:protein phosphatase 2C domain-containing protein n=1 Tax=Streptomyces olivochromogenes TaxID=1963 RepID=UPI0027E490A9|nr:protein phosphatase 2C domain-containing protein [Streptomyces olivochromogenes]MCF3137159.1 protein phosphatase 2C domain-containing protein [Streptomyces olivochromogenes]